MVHHRSSAGFMKISALGVEEHRVNVVLDVVESSPAARASLGDDYRVEVRVVTWESPSMLKVATSELCATGERWGSVGSTTSRCGCPDHSAAICRSRRRSHATPLSLENATSTGNGPYIPDHTEGPKAGRVDSWPSLPHCPTWTVRLTAAGGLVNDRRPQDFARSWKNSHSDGEPFRRFGTPVTRSGKFVAHFSWVGEATRAVSVARLLLDYVK